MSSPQLLTAVCLLGLDFKSMLDPKWFGFDKLSTHLVKCALAASAAVDKAKGKRPSVKDTLACLGFQLDGHATSDHVQAQWAALVNLTPAFSSSVSSSDYHSRTLQLSAGLQLVETDSQGALL